MNSTLRGMLTDGAFSGPGHSGMMLSEGYFWTRRLGGYDFYLGRNGVTGINFSNPVAVCGPDASPFVLGGLFDEAGDYWLAVRAVSTFGVFSTGYAWRRIRVDESGDGWGVPGEVENLRSRLGPTGRVVLEWDYSMDLGQPVPSTFNIYVAVGDAPINFSSPYASVDYRPSQRTYVWDSIDLAGTSAYRLVVRAESADGIEDNSQRGIIARADSTMPGSIEAYELEQADS